MRNIKIDEFLNYNFLSDVEFSPDGQKICFAVSKSNVDDNTYNSNLWIYDLKENREYQLTTFNKERSFFWLDNDFVVFQGMRNSKDGKLLEAGEQFTQYYKININGGEATEFIRIPMMVAGLWKIDDNNFLFAGEHTVGRKDFWELDTRGQDDYKKDEKEMKDYEILEEIPYWSNGEGFISKKRQRLYRYEILEKKIHPVTDDISSVGNITIRGEKAVFTALSYEGKAEIKEKLYLYDMESGKLKILCDDNYTYYGVMEFVDDENVLLSGSEMKRYGLNENGGLYIVNIVSGIRRPLNPEYDKSIGSSVGSDCRLGGGKYSCCDEGKVYFTINNMHSSYLEEVDPKTGISRQVTSEEGSVDCFDVKNGRIAMIAMRGQKLQELYIVEEMKEKQITTFNAWVNKELKIAVPEECSFNTSDGTFIEGWVLKPVDFNENYKYPAILDIHGGPKTEYGQVFYHEMQVWASKGYFVLFCNPRGSDGRGNEFADIRGKYGTIDYDDIMKFTDVVLEKYENIDGKRIGVTGGSYGGFMTNWIIGHTDRFKAAASQRSISNWVSKFCTTDIGYYFVDDQISATPWSNIEKLWFHSPLKYADKVKTPTLFIHSGEDYRCWMAEGLQMFNALKYHGVEARLCLFKGENHELSRSGKPKHRIKRLEEITNWFDSYLR